MRASLRIVVVGLLFAAFSAAPAHAFHLYRGPGGGCLETDGPLGATATPATTVKMLHNLFLDGTTNTPVTHIKAGDTVRWTWNSLHCHSVQFDAGTPAGPNGEEAYSHFYYPTYVPPGFVNAVPGFFEYPQLSDNPTLSWSFTFTTPGVYHYQCEHHAVIGMHGVVVVDAA